MQPFLLELTDVVTRTTTIKFQVIKKKVLASKIYREKMEEMKCRRGGVFFKDATYQ